MSATSIDSTLDWQVGDPEAPSWFRRQLYSAEHRDGDGTYVINQTERRRVFILDRGSATGQYGLTPALWQVAFHARSADQDAVIMPRSLQTSEFLDVVMAAAVEHHAAGRRANAWAKYMRENDPPEVTR